MLCAADEDSLAGICTSSQKHISDRQTGWKADRQTETCCVELMRNPCWSLYIWSEANFRGLWLRCRSCSTCNHSLHCRFLLYQLVGVFFFFHNIYFGFLPYQLVGFFFHNIYFGFLLYQLVGVFFHNIYFGFLLYQFVGVFCFFHSLYLSFLLDQFAVFCLLLSQSLFVISSLPVCGVFCLSLLCFSSSLFFFIFFHKLYL